ncbi:MAG: YceI family protein [Salibacteraceae bacterium]
MKNSILLIALTLMIGQTAFSQGKYFTRDGHVSFFSETPVEDIEAHNEKMTCVLDSDNGNVEFAVLIKSFEFEKALMEEHFNENYMESNEFPKATFKGTIQEFVGIRDSGFPPGVEMIAKGTMMIHGVEKPVEAVGYVDNTSDGLRLRSTFLVAPEDYDIEIPNTVRENIAKEITVTVDADLKPLKK